MNIKILLTRLSLFLILLHFTTTLYCQKSDTKTSYKAPGIYIVTLKNGVEELRKPIGNNVTITYDSFFKSFFILYTNEDGISESLDLEYLKDEDFMKGVKTVKMIDKFKNIYYVVNLLAEIGKLKILVPKEYSDGSTAWIFIEDSKKITQ